jgi:D-alanyl-D-alanine carboxypeptidase
VPRFKLLLLALCALLLPAALAQNTLPPATTAAIDSAVADALASTGVPSASIAVVSNGVIAYTHAYGKAQLEPPRDAAPSMRYAIGSVSKQFTAAAVLMLAEQGKLSLDDTVSKWLPDLTRANEVTLREVLSHTSGYQDFFPQDYDPPLMLKPTTADFILNTWAKKPLDFDPGTQWQYSNTNYVIAGKIVEQVSGMSIFSMLEQCIFKPLNMTSARDIDAVGLDPHDAVGYLRHALGPLRPAPHEGKGWMFAAGELAMTADDLAKWDISMLNHTVLKPASYDDLERAVKLKDGKDTNYALGVQVFTRNGHRVIAHSGEVGGFVSDNIVLPDDHAAIVVLTNKDASSAAGEIAHKVATLLMSPPAPESAGASNVDAIAKKIYIDLSQGKIDRSLFTDNANFYFNQQALDDYASSLGPLGPPFSFKQTGDQPRGGMTYRSFEAKLKDKTVRVTTYQMPDGKWEQFLVEPAD